MLKIKQIGNGGAFNYKETNSSFVINKDNKLILFDCGYSVYHKLRELDESKEISLKDLGAVYISHFDDDHIGSLKTLIYYQYFVNNIVMDILVPNSLYDEMQLFLKDLNGYYDNYEKIEDQMFDIYAIECGVLEYNDLILETIECNHHVECHGLIIGSNEDKKLIYISGDTKAINLIDNYILMLKETHQDYEFLIFHDYSNWNCPEKQVHMCKDNMEKIYKPEFIQMLNFYHNDDLNYNKEWR